MKVAIVGSRDWTQPRRVIRHVEQILTKYPDAVVISGGARGVDRAAERAAQLGGLGVISYRPYEYVNMGHEPEFSIETIMLPEGSSDRRINPPFFKSYGAAAFHRNKWIVEDADVVVAFHAHGSRGTADSIQYARKLSKPLFIYEPN